MFKILLVVILSCVFWGRTLGDSPQYTTKYDNIDLENLVSNERLLKNYVDCLLDKGKCTPDGLELKKNMPDAIETNCSKCSEKQKQGSEYIIHYLIDHKPAYWEPLEAKYDPSGAYKKSYLESKPKNEEQVNHEPVNND